MHVSWHGVFPALTTQFGDDLHIDLEATKRHLDILMAAGIHGVITLGTVGENCSLDADEKVAVVRGLVEHVRGRIPVLTGVAECTTAQACRFAAAVEQVGVDGLMVLPAMVYKADEREAMHHYRTVANASGLPILVYNNPVAYKVDLSPEAFQALEDVPTLVAIKESSENPRRITELRRRCGDRYALFCGVDDLIFESVLLGATGWVAGLVNAFPQETMLLWRLLADMELDDARAVYRWFQPLLQLDTMPKLVQYIKLAAQHQGLGRETVRPPRLTLDGAERATVLGILRQAAEERSNVPAFAAVAR